MSHTFTFNGEPVTVHRPHPAAHLPCPCGAEKHARLSFLNIKQILRLNPHPGPDDGSAFPDVKPDPKQPLPSIPSIQISTTSAIAGPSNVFVNSESVSYGTIPAEAVASDNRLISDISVPPAKLDDPVISMPSALASVFIQSAPLNKPETEATVGTFSAGLLGSDNQFILDQSVSPAGLDSAVISMPSSLDPVSVPSAPLDKPKTQAIAIHSIIEENSDEEYDEEDPAEDLPDYDESSYLNERPFLSTLDIVVQKTRQQLTGYQLIVDPNFNRIICLFCQSLIPFERVHRHAYEHTVGNRLKLSKDRQIPNQETLEELLMLLDGHKPVLLGTAPIPPFEGIDIITGIKCDLPSCPNRHLIHSSRAVFFRHCKLLHPQYAGKNRKFSEVQCQALSRNSRERQIREISHLPTTDVNALTGILANTKLIGLGNLSTTYVPTRNAHARSLILDQMHWHVLLKDVDLAQLRCTAQPPHQDLEPHLYRLGQLVKQYYTKIAEHVCELDILTRRLIRSPEPKLSIKHKPFMMPQETNTLSEYSDFIAYFLVFIIRHVQKPMAKFSVPLHPETLALFMFLEQSLEDSNISDSSIINSIHKCIWGLLSCPSDNFLRNDTQDPFTRFLITYHLKDDYGTLAPPPQFPHNISRAQWCFRATACWEIISLAELTGSPRQGIYEQHIKPWIHEGDQHMFNSLRQSMLHLTVLAKAQPGIARFNWNTTRTCLSIDGFPIVLKKLYQSIDTTISRVESLIDRLFRGCFFHDILKYIDSRMDPSADCAEHWFRDDPKNEDIKFSVFSMQENDFKQFEHRLLHHLSKDSKLFQQIQGTIKARAELWEWFGLLDEIVGLLFCLASTTWGGGARGTECDDMRYANNKDGGRHLFIINNTLTFISTYTKSRNIHGVTRQVAHSPSFRVSRLLLLLLSSVYPAAAHMAVMCLMPKEHAENYLTHVFVQSGHIMKTDNFSKALASFTKHTLNCPM
ncbi:hypothetical protein C0992_012929, partial [Termitomyces sp. T32_za158]